MPSRPVPKWLDVNGADNADLIPGEALPALFALLSIVLEHLGAIPLEPDILMTSHPLAQDRFS